MFFKTSFRNTRISTKFNLFLSFVFITGILLSGVVLSITLQQRAQAEVTSKALLIMQTMNSIRDYTQDRVNPLLKSRLETETTFIPEAIPTFSVREVFEYFRKDPDFENFFYKDAAPNPTNLRDKADDFETKLVEKFRHRPDLKEQHGFREFPEGKLFYIAQPFAIKQSACLQCHSTPDVAPKSMLTTYGTKAGFGWKLNDIIAAQVVYVPAEEIFANARFSFINILSVFISIFIIIILLFNFLLKRTVIRRIRKIAKTAQAVSTGDMKADFEENSKDEIGLLAVAFNRMKASLEVAMKLLNK